MTGPPTPTSPDSGFTIPSETFKAVGWFVLRLALTLVIVSRLILFLSEPLQHLIARGAHNLLAMVSWQYDLKTIEYIDGGLGVGSLMGIFCSRVGPFARDSERFVIRLLIGGTKKSR